MLLNNKRAPNTPIAPENGSGDEKERREPKNKKTCAVLNYVRGLKSLHPPSTKPNKKPVQERLMELLKPLGKEKNPRAKEFACNTCGPHFCHSLSTCFEQQTGLKQARGTPIAPKRSAQETRTKAVKLSGTASVRVRSSKNKHKHKKQ